MTWRRRKKTDACNDLAGHHQYYTSSNTERKARRLIHRVSVCYSAAMRYEPWANIAKQTQSCNRTPGRACRHTGPCKFSAETGRKFSREFAQGPHGRHGAVHQNRMTGAITQDGSDEEVLLECPTETWQIPGRFNADAVRASRRKRSSASGSFAYLSARTLSATAGQFRVFRARRPHPSRRR